MEKRYLILPASSGDEGDSIVNCCLIELEQVQEDLGTTKAYLERAKVPPTARVDFCLGTSVTFADVEYDQLERWGLEDGPSYQVADVDEDIIDTYGLRVDSVYLRMSNTGFTYWEGLEHHSYTAISAGCLSAEDVYEILDIV